jgi:hypothetical protein
MKSPFPGMDPYLESHWGDVHTSLTTYARNQLRPQLPADLKVRVEEYIAVEASNVSDDQHYVPDVRVIERHGSREAGTAVMAASDIEVADEPLRVPTYFEPPTQREIRIIDQREGGRIITVIEILSATNKKSGRQEYRRKQHELLEAGVSLVELDLLRSGHWVLSIHEEKVRDTYRGPYRICVIRGSDPGYAEMYRASYAARLPRIRVPLRPTDQDAILDVQSLIDQAYEDGGYGDIDYRQNPEPPFLPEEHEWADKLLREAGRR